MTIVNALEQLTSEQIDRLRFRLWQRFAMQLSKVTDAPDADDLLQEAYQDLLADKRHCPVEHLDVVHCLFNIVRSKVSHLYAAWRKEGIVKESVEILDYMPDATAGMVEDSPLRTAILELVKDDHLLLSIVEYRLDHAEEEPIKAQQMAAALGAPLSDIYNANRRLKARLASLV